MRRRRLLRPQPLLTLVPASTIGSLDYGNAIDPREQLDRTGHSLAAYSAVGFAAVAAAAAAPDDGGPGEMQRPPTMETCETMDDGAAYFDRKSVDSCRETYRTAGCYWSTVISMVVAHLRATAPTRKMFLTF